MEQIINKGRRSGKRVEQAINLCEYLNKLPENKMYGVTRRKGTISITEEEVIVVKVIKNKLKKLSKELSNLNKIDRTLTATEHDRIDTLYYQIDILEEVIEEGQE